MFRVIKFILICNLVSVALVYGIEKYTGFFGLRYVSDYAFFVVALIWGITALFYIYSPNAGYGDDRVDRKTTSMVDTSVADEIDDHRFAENTVLCVKLFVSGIPAFFVSFFSGSLFGA
ncbi:hypothetical protein [Vibrio sp. 99-70-13A1]|uniref:hypothetical protein n=1 Tax=Vibrio sp. 99-70-13A1 TaxID=2607601 RepID=UPI001493755E|nr:hypothetical protein [Vibrio sp. 99-70-13A1]NOH99477.1 hypothetical protein [Vibrio sp. 99-70-13A1]